MLEFWRGIAIALAGGRGPNRNVLRGAMSLGREPTNFVGPAQVLQALPSPHHNDWNTRENFRA